MRPRTSTRQRGFTLIETMTVVVIVGVLAALATYGVRKYIFSAKSTEARQMMLSIKSAEEAYREETYQYLPTTNSLSGSSLYPHVCIGIVPGAKKVAWEQSDSCGTGRAFRTLGVQSSSPVMYGYAVAIRESGSTMPVPSGITYSFNNVPETGPAFVVFAMGDLNGDGVFSKFVGSNFTDEIYAENENE